jgi:hypothetical protein
MESKQEVGIKKIVVRYAADFKESLITNSLSVYFNTAEEAESFFTKISKQPDRFFYTHYFSSCSHNVELRGVNCSHRKRSVIILQYLDNKYVLPSEFIISYPSPIWSMRFKEITLPFSRNDWLGLPINEFFDKLALRNSALTENLSKLITSEVSVDIIYLKAKPILDITCLSTDNARDLKRMTFNEALVQGKERPAPYVYSDSNS